MRGPVNSFKFQSCDRTPQADGLMRLLHHALSGIVSHHRLRRGLLGYLILFAPHAFVLQCQNPDQTAAFATGVLPYIYAFHRYTWSSVDL